MLHHITSLAYLPRKKPKLANKTQKVVKPFSKLRPTKKDRLILKCSAKPSAVFNAINVAKLIEGDDTTEDVVHIPGASKWYCSFQYGQLC